MNMTHGQEPVSLGLTYPVIAGIRVGGVGRDDVRYPAEQATSADPKSRRDDQPQDTGQDAPVVELADSGDDRTQNSCQSGITHRYSSPPVVTHIFISDTYSSEQGFPTLSIVASPTRARIGLRLRD